MGEWQGTRMGRGIAGIAPGRLLGANNDIVAHQRARVGSGHWDTVVDILACLGWWAAEDGNSQTCSVVGGSQ
jgi:hypothetical protein